MKGRQTAYHIDCGHRLVLPDNLGLSRHGETVKCRVCGTSYKLFVFECGHGFVWDPEKFDSYTRSFKELDRSLKGNEDSCLDCKYPGHRPIEGVCEVCSKPVSITVGNEMVCDKCLPQALVKSLGNVGMYKRLDESKN